MGGEINDETGYQLVKGKFINNIDKVICKKKVFSFYKIIVS